ncbi:tryptophan synthase alpha chain [Halarchaeum acidiphilum MH1-52-1]|uniref:Tryptophan synthase alpha chain n=1 Tax=Halarchaeum acidiphilum MH1-52-1 TaxID=1261545 RepID=U3ACB0_9EURY|nr:tryptophan synthase subunit alpha [Halarchaeum acidiphilum]GAD52408.1 tryptophan synthase alpha chain [Halarchaeum acidiphilum MH1-52-1]
MSVDDVTAAFADGPALIPYVVAGDPSADATEAYVEALAEGGADVIELGLPFSEPIADGPTIQEGIRRALDAGMTPARYLDLVRDLDVDAPIVCMTYYNLLLQFGDGDEVETFVETAADAGVSGLIVPDLPVEESAELEAACAEHDVALIFIVAPTTTPERVERILERASGFVYVQARMGTTGARTDVSEDTYESLDRLPEGDLPYAVGFGVSEREHAKAIVEGGADGVVAGSVFVDAIAEAESTESAADALREKAAELAAGIDAAESDETPEPETTK